MHNFTVPAVLRAWIDHVVRISRTFRGTREGNLGLLPNRPVLVVMDRSGAAALVAKRGQLFCPAATC